MERTVQQKGKLIIPAFSVGRTQQIVYALNRLCERGDLPSVPIFVDSPLAVDATTVYRSHFDSFDEETQQQILSEEDRNPLAFESLHYIRKAEHSKALNSLAGPAVIISASGMCEAGRVLHHLKNNIEQESTTILFAGYQAPYTLGRRILDGAETARIFGREYQVKARVYRLEGTSGHADQQELLNWAAEIENRGNLRQSRAGALRTGFGRNLPRKIRGAWAAERYYPRSGGRDGDGRLTRFSRYRTRQ